MHIKKYSSLLFSHTFREFFISMFSVFLPIFLLQKGYPLLFVLGYFLVYYICSAFLLIPLLKFIIRIGLSRSFLIAYLFTLLFYGTLYFFDSFMINKLILLVIILILHQVGEYFYWYSYHLLFVVGTKEGEIGSNLGKIMSYPKFLKIISPLSGAFLAYFFSFKLLFFVIFAFMTVITLPLIINKYDKIIANKFSYLDVFRFRFIKRNKVYFFEGMVEIPEEILWPLHLFLIKLKLTIVGIFVSLVALGRGLMVLFIGKALDRINKHDRISRIGLFFISFGAFFRVLFLNKILMFVSQTFGSFGIPMYKMPIMTDMYKRCKTNIIESIAGREISLALGRVLILSIALLTVVVFDAQDMKYIFLIFSILFLFVSLFSKKLLFSAKNYS